MDNEYVKLEKRGKVAIITMDRQERFNALGRELSSQLAQIVSRVEADRELVVAVITGAGDRAYSVGADLKDPATHSSDSIFDSIEMFTGWGESDPIPRMKKPIIAAVNGFCSGGGLEQALRCDMIIASDQATFWYPQTGLGLFPGLGTPHLVRAIGRVQAMKFILTGEHLSAQEAFRLGLVNEVVAHAELMPRVLSLAEEIAAKAPLGIVFAKQSVNRGAELPLRDAVYEDGMRLFPLYNTEDRKEASRAFLEKRPPVFHGR